MTTTTIPGELFLLLTDDAGRQDSSGFRRQALAAAAITELMLREKVTLEEGKNPRVHVVDDSSLDIPVLDQALGALSELQGTRITSVIGHRSMDLVEVIGTGFAAVGAVQRKDGWFGTGWPTRDATLERSVRARLAGVIREPARASVQDVILLEMLRGLGIAHRILRADVPELRRRELDAVITGFALEHPAAAAVKKVVADMAAVLLAVSIAAGAAASAS